MKITRFEVLRVPPCWVWLKIHTDDGLYGLGEPYLENQPEAVIAEVLRFEPLLVGRDPRDIEAHWNAMYRSSGSSYLGGPVTMSAISGIDIALWDLAGKIAGLPVHAMLGGKCRDSVRVYRAIRGGWPQERLASMRRSGMDPVEQARSGVQEWGYRCLKVHFGSGRGIPSTSEVDAAGEHFARLREAAGRDVDVAVDLHNPHPSVASQLIDVLTPHRPLFIEEPMPIERVDALRQIVEGKTCAPIAAGERWMGKWIFFDALKSGVLSVVQPDICHAGGITECKKIAAMAEAAYADVAIHCPLSPVALAAAIQLDAAIPNFLVQEHHQALATREKGRTYIGKEYFENPFQLDDDGCVRVPEGPGLGIHIDDGRLAEIMTRPWQSRRI